MAPKKGQVVADGGQEQTVVDAAPEHIYEMVADLPRMGEWSPECQSVEWEGGAAGPAEGARFVGHNRGGPSASCGGRAGAGFSPPNPAGSSPSSPKRVAESRPCGGTASKQSRRYQGHRVVRGQADPRLGPHRRRPDQPRPGAAGEHASHARAAQEPSPRRCGPGPVVTLDVGPDGYLLEPARVNHSGLPEASHLQDDGGTDQRSSRCGRGACAARRRIPSSQTSTRGRSLVHRERGAHVLAGRRGDDRLGRLLRVRATRGMSTASGSIRPRRASSSFSRRRGSRTSPAAADARRPR